MSDLGHLLTNVRHLTAQLTFSNWLRSTEDAPEKRDAKGRPLKTWPADTVVTKATPVGVTNMRQGTRLAVDVFRRLNFKRHLNF